MPASAMAPAVPANLFSLRRNSSPFHESGLLNSEKRLGVGIAPTTNVLDQLRAALGAIAAPKLTAVYTVVCTEIELTVENRQMFRQRACSTRWVNVLDHGSATFATITAPQLKAICAVIGFAPTTNVLDQLRAALGAIAAPKLTAVYTVVCTEIELTVENRQMFRQRACSTRWVNVLDHGSATFATITAPQLKAICAVIGF